MRVDREVFERICQKIFEHSHGVERVVLAFLECSNLRPYLLKYYGILEQNLKSQKHDNLSGFFSLRNKDWLPCQIEEGFQHLQVLSIYRRTRGVVESPLGGVPWFCEQERVSKHVVDGFD